MSLGYDNIMVYLFFWFTFCMKNRLKVVNKNIAEGPAEEVLSSFKHLLSQQWYFWKLLR